MFRLLIIDDERYIVESLAELFSSQQDLELDILMAYYGDEALNILENTKVDIVFLDIKMPGISGIDVARQITVNWPNCKIIFFTGYASFDYIYEIKNIKNATFLLKTEDNDTIISVLKQSIAELKKQYEYQQLTSQAEQVQMRLTYLLHADILRDFLNGKTLLELRKIIDRNKESFHFDLTLPIHLLYLKTKWDPNGDGKVNFYQQIISLTAYFYHNLNERYRISLVDMDADTFMLFIQPIAGIQPMMNMSHNTYIRECLNDCISSSLPAQNCHLLVLNCEQEISWHQIGKTFDFYHQYYNNLLLSSFPQYDSVITCRIGDIRPDSSESVFPPISVPQSLFSNLVNSLRTGNLQEIFAVLQQLQETLVHIGSMHHLAAISLYQRVSNIYIDFIIQYHLTEKIALLTGLYKLYNLGQFQSWEDLISYYKELSVLLLQTIAKEESDSRKRTIAQVENFIKNNLHRSLSLNEIANAVNYNRTYLSRLFVKTTGENLSQYILRLKMEKAEHYLTHSNESIQSIAEKLGFDTSQYFSMVFKKYTGLSPRDFRNQSMY